jgi:large subunit ribosomal protein L23
MAVISASGITLEPYQVVLKPLVTEKGTHISNRFNAYTFEVHLQATKTDIRNAVEALWHVRCSHAEPGGQATANQDW